MTALLVKLQPNQDVTEALEAELARSGFRRARILAAVGSIVEGRLMLRDGSNEAVEGPALEVAALSGEVRAAGGSQLHAYLCRTDTSVVGGILAPGLNAVAVTFELLLACDDT